MNESGSNVIYHVLPGGAQLDSVPLNALQSSGSLRVSTTDNRWFDPYRILRIVPDPDSIATYSINPYCDLYIHEIGTWPIAAFKQKSFVLPAGTQTVVVPVIVDRTSVGDYLPTLVVKGRGGKGNWTKSAVAAFELESTEKTVSMGVTNYTGEDVTVTYTLTEPTNCTIGPHNTCKVTVKGLPSTFSLATKQKPFTVKEGRDINIKVVMDLARSYDVVLPVILDTPLDAPAGKAGYDFLLPPTLVIPAGTKSASLRVQLPLTADPTGDRYRYLRFTFGNPVDSTMGSWAGGSAPFVSIRIEQKANVKIPSVWTPSSTMFVDVERPFSLYVGGTGSTLIGAGGKDLQGIMQGTLESDGTYHWAPLTNNLGNLTPGVPVALTLKVTNDVNNLGNFSLPIRVKSGVNMKTINLKVTDRRPKLYPQYITRISPIVDSLTIYPMDNAEYADRLATQAEASSTYISTDWMMTPYTAVTSGHINPASVFITPPTEDFYKVSAYVEDKAWAQLNIGATAFSPSNNQAGANNEIALDTAYILLGDESLRRANGFYAQLNDTILPSRTLSAWGTYINPFSSYKKAGKTKRIKFRRGTDEFDNRVVICPSNIRLYDKRELKRTANEGRYSDAINQFETVGVSVGVKTDTGAFETDRKFFIYAPVVDGVQTWCEGVDFPVRNYYDQSTLAYTVAPVHNGTILKISGRYFGKHPKVWLECFRNSAAPLIKANCKVLSIIPSTTHYDEGQYIMTIQLPAALPGSWHYDEPNLINYAASRSRLIINSGAGLTGIQLAIRPFTQVSQTDNAFPTAIQTDDIIYRATYNQDKVLDIPVTMMPFSKSTYAPGYLTNDINGDALTITKVWLEQSQYMNGSVSIIKNEAGGQSIRFRPKQETGSITVHFTVKEKCGGANALRTDGYFRIIYE